MPRPDVATRARHRFEGRGERAKRDGTRVHPENVPRRRVADAPNLPGEVLALAGAEPGKPPDGNAERFQAAERLRIEARVVDRHLRMPGQSVLTEPSSANRVVPYLLQAAETTRPEPLAQT